ncbi:unnamed protein product [Strongylus vulgaris]|uniref:Metalloendopeptidase n=1 Tax=Strongylus vulgaris TaxID=40348 RepID=A0A3P7K4I9_STRVU|nr:unnamed protein product [Strongylus vulgaris]
MIALMYVAPLTTVPVDPTLSGEPDIEEINQKSGIADYLFQSDINLTEEQLDWLEKEAALAGTTRPKRQVASNAALWPNKRVYYHYAASIGKKLFHLYYPYKLHHYYSFSDARMKTINATAPNRVRVFKGTGCWSNIGMIGGVQDLSLGNGCDVVGIVAHEFSHTLGTFHTQMRSDRDDYVAIDLRNVPVSFAYKRFFETCVHCLSVKM